MAREIDFPPVWLAVFVVLGGLIGRLWPITFPYSSEIGAGLLVLGLLLMVLAALQMLMVRTAIMPRQEASTLITGGVFRLSRNPIYLGDVLFLTGLLVNWGALISLPLVPVFMMVLYHRFIAEEEERLTRDYGEIYTGYQSTTRRWI
ncbi:MAG: isoprenylcysteine carboxylmethyltransferase family protein [Rhodobacteraceae bacterium]|nr:isoprenylcysteine carboxylmethyltransferase family protein [Paracoccaceae bacterium]MCP5342859.1 isoprenylcysteine carboxylmethyltransferase family protein [Paracoccaceae bacterium]